MTRIVSNWRINTKNTKLEHIDQFRLGDIFFVPGYVPPLALKHWIQVYGNPDFIVCDHAGSVNIDGLKIYSAPLRGLAFAFEKFENFDQKDLPRQVNTKFCFNFFVNNSIGRTNRHVLLKLVEYFELDCFDYILNDAAKYHDMQYVINELNTITNDEFSEDFRNKLLAPTTLSTKHNKNFSYDKFDELASYKSHIWKNDIEMIFNTSAVSLVGEFWYGSQLASIFSEKTILAIIGLTFPIFVGGYGHADYLKQVGLDVFDDVIDHSYQHRTTLIEQCFYAFKDNLHILTDLQLAKNLREKHLDRLLKNRDLLYEHILTKHVYTAVDAWPEPLRSSIGSYWYFIQNLQVGKVMRQDFYAD